MKHLCVLLLATFTSISSLFAQQAPSDEPVPRLRADLVVIDLLPVQTKTGRILPDLTKDDVVLFEDGVKQTLSHFSRGQEPVSILLLVDRAGCVNAFNEQIRAATEHGELKRVLSAEFQEPGEILFGGRLDVEIRLAADAQRGAFGERFIAAHDGIRRETRRQLGKQLFV